MILQIIRNLFLEKILIPNNVEYWIFDENILFPKLKHKYEKDAFKRHIKRSQILLSGIIKQYNNNKNNNENKKLSIIFAGSTIPSMLQSYISQLMTPYIIYILS